MVKDLKLENNDLYINHDTGDFDIVESDIQHIEDIINAFPGWWKGSPSLGVGAMAYYKSSGKQQELEANIRRHLQADNIVVTDLKTKQEPDGTFKITELNGYRS